MEIKKVMYQVEQFLQAVAFQYAPYCFSNFEDHVSDPTSICLHIAQFI